MQSDVLYILDKDNINISKYSKVVFLNKDSEQYSNRLNVLDIFYKEQDELRNKLLIFNRKVFEKTKHLMDKDEDYNYLLTFLFFEKSPYKTNKIYLFYKLNIIIDYIKTHNIKKIFLNTNQSSIVKFFIKFTKQNNIDLENLQQSKKTKSIKNIVMKNFYLSTLYFLKRECIKVFKKINKNKQVHNKLVVSYYPNYYFDKDCFISKYYSNVSKELNKNYDWLFIYADDISKINQEQDILKEYNFDAYNFLDSFISIGDMFQIVKKANQLYCKFKKINTEKLFYFGDVDYYDILIDDWKKSTSFVLLDTLIFEKKFCNLLNTKEYTEIIYLLEYQPWEAMLNRVAHKIKNITTKGIMHSVLRPNLVNYSHEPSVHKYMFTPDYIGSNSPLSDIIFEQNGFSKEQIKYIEAQRFSYLSNINDIKKEKNNNLLITTSIDYEETKELLDNFSFAYKVKVFDCIYIKGHPDLPVIDIIKKIDNFPEYRVLNGNMKDALDLVDTVFTANSSSVLLEAILNKKKTITFFSLKTLPMPAVDNHKLLSIATNLAELENIFLNILNNKITIIEENNLLYLDSHFNYWNEFINVK